MIGRVGSRASSSRTERDDEGRAIRDNSELIRQVGSDSLPADANIVRRARTRGQGGRRDRPTEGRSGNVGRSAEPRRTGLNMAAMFVAFRKRPSSPYLVPLGSRHLPKSYDADRPAEFRDVIGLGRPLLG